MHLLYFNILKQNRDFYLISSYKTPNLFEVQISAILNKGSI